MADPAPKYGDDIPASTRPGLRRARPAEALARRALAGDPGPALSSVLRSPPHPATTPGVVKIPPLRLPEMRPVATIEPSRVRAVAASPDAEARLRLAAFLVPGALAVANLGALWDALEALGDERTVVVVDLRTTRATRAQLEELDRRGPLVLWGGSEDLPGAVPCAAHETPEQVAALVMRLLDAS